MFPGLRNLFGVGTPTQTYEFVTMTGNVTPDKLFLSV
jgi:hypothetical protein